MKDVITSLGVTQTEQSKYVCYGLYLLVKESKSFRILYRQIVIKVGSERSSGSGLLLSPKKGKSQH